MKPIAKALAGQLSWKDHGLPDLRTMMPSGVAPELLRGANTRAKAIDTLRHAFGIAPGGSIDVDTPAGSVRIEDAKLPHVIGKREDMRERFGAWVLPTLREPTEIWRVAYDDGSVRHRYIKLFSGTGYDLLVIVTVAPNSGVFWNMMHRARKRMNDLRIGDRVWPREGR